MKTLTYLRSSTPENPAIGYGDHWQLVENGNTIAGGHCSTCPNPYRPSDRTTWQKAYALVDVGEYTFLCNDHPHFGKCLFINDGGKVPTVNPNTNHEGQYYATGIFVHYSRINTYNNKWRGSAGCFTHSREEWQSFIDNFKIGERGKLILKNFISGHTHDNT